MSINIYRKEKGDILKMWKNRLYGGVLLNEKKS